ncbi:hypothetical protein UPYG_G00057420 [Umbra pygmaea]|uniref:Uncharacterized protein n=1 Tax=Umbra pygmaea TaxID=75934 RepID=A0ABD0XNM4_UMBPY
MRQQILMFLFIVTTGQEVDWNLMEHKRPWTGGSSDQRSTSFNHKRTLGNETRTNLTTARGEGRQRGSIPLSETFVADSEVGQSPGFNSTLQGWLVYSSTQEGLAVAGQHDREVSLFPEEEPDNGADMSGRPQPAEPASKAISSLIQPSRGSRAAWVDPEPTQGHSGWADGAEQGPSVEEHPKRNSTAGVKGHS